MKESLQPNSQQPQKSAAESSARSFRQTSAEGRGQSHLAQLAASINQSPRVQTQLKLAEELQEGAQSHIGGTSGINQTAQAKSNLKEKKPAQKIGKHDEKKKPGQLQADPKKKKPAQLVNKEKKPKQMKFADSPAVAQLEEAPSANLTGLPDQIKAGVENLSGISLDDVKVHYNSAKPKELNALAYAQGTDIHVAPGQEKHLPHEAWHIVQQKQGRVQPTVQMKEGVPVNDDAGLEREADLMGAKALQRVAIAGNEGALYDGYGHAEDCACPGCCQTKLAQPAGDPSVAVQMTGARPIQLACKHCGRKSGHRNDCPRHKNNLRAKTEEKKEVHQENQSWTNLNYYRSNWVSDNNIMEGQVKKFCRDTKLRIRGHHSGDNSKGEQGNTTQDLIVFKSWFTQNYGWQ